MQFQVNSLRGSVHGIQDFASGRPGIKQCSALNCVCSFWVNSLQGEVHGFREFASGHPGSTHCSALNCVCSFQVNSLWGLVHGIRDFCLWVSWDQTLLGNEVCIHCQFNSLRDRFTGFGSRLWASGKQSLLCIEMHTRLGLSCVCSFRSTQCSLLLVFASWFGSSPHSKAITWLTNHHQASR
jgi:hypothetical protein